MGKPRKFLNNDEESGGAPEWLTTYSDLVTLLLTFFIMLFSMAVIDQQKFIQVTNSLKSRFSFNSNGDLLLSNSGKDYLKIIEQNNAIDEDKAQVNNQSGVSGSGDQQLENVKKNILNEIEELGLGDYVSVIEEKKFLMLRIDSAILFDLGSAEIKKDGQEVLINLSKMFNKLDNEIVVQGHTDNLPINTMLYPTNWELSTKRATNVVLFLVEKCGLDPTRLTATGNGEFRPIRPNDTEENRQKNRRIDIEIVK